MAKFPGKVEAEALLSSLEPLFKQRVEQLVELATYLRVKNRPVEVMSGTLFVITVGGMCINNSVYVLAGSGELRHWSEWSNEQKIDFVANYDTICNSYAEDVERVYGALKAAKEWKHII